MGKPKYLAAASIANERIRPKKIHRYRRIVRPRAHDGVEYLNHSCELEFEAVRLA